MDQEWSKYLHEVVDPSAAKTVPRTARNDISIKDILRSLCDSLDVSAAAFGQIIGREYRLHTIHERQGDALLPGMRLRLEETTTAPALMNQAAFTVEDVGRFPDQARLPEFSGTGFVAALTVPISNDEGTIFAALNIWVRQPRTFKPSEIHLTGILSRIIYDCYKKIGRVPTKLSSKNVSEATQQTTDYFDALSELIQLNFLAAASLDEFEQQAMALLIKVSHARYISIATVDDKQFSLQIQQVGGVPENGVSDFKRDQVTTLLDGLLNKAILNKQPVVIEDIFSANLGKPLRVHAGQWGYAALVSIPMTNPNSSADDSIVTFYFDLPKQFEATHLLFLRLTVTYLAAALASAALVHQLEAEQSLGTLINEAANALTSSINLNEIFSSLINRLEKMVDFDHANIMLLESEPTELAILALISSRKTPLKEGMRFRPDSEPLLWSTLTERKIAFMKDLKHVSTPLNQMLIKEGMHSSITLPLIYKNEQLGVFLLASVNPNNFTEREAAILDQLAAPVASAIKNAGLYMETMKQREKIDAVNQELKNLDKSKQDLTDMIVHDLRNPLSGIIGYLSLLIQYTELTEQQKEFADQAKTNSELMLNMISTLLDITKLEVGQMNLDRRLILSSEIISAAFNQTRGMAIPKNITLCADLAYSDLKVYGDAQFLIRVLVNLVGNAIKFVPESGHVSIKTWNEVVESRIISVFQVIDDGEGIPPEYHQKIFEKFGQVDIRKSGDKFSTGLGLTFCKLAVEAHGGKIHVDSSIGQGCVFTFDIPHLSVAS